MAQQSGELVRLAIVDGEHLTWVAKSQGARKGVRYDPDIGTDERLSCTATGHAWLLTLSDECALDLVSGPGLRRAEGLRPQGADHRPGAAEDAARGVRARASPRWA